LLVFDAGRRLTPSLYTTTQGCPDFKDPDGMSEEFKDFIRKCTVMDPEQRMSTTQLLSVRA
jgi:serine/threonine protein kinase